jgi:hypothetical protein
MPIRCGICGGGRLGALLVAGRGNESRGAIISSTTERRSVCLTARSPGEKRRDSVSANLFARDGIHFEENWSPSSSSTFIKRRSSLIVGLLDATNAFVTCTTLELSTQSLNKEIPSFLTRSTSVSMRTIRISLSCLTEMYSALSFHSRISWFCHCPVSPVARNVQLPTKAHVRCICMHYSVGWKRSNWASICLGARQFPSHMQVPYRLMTQPAAILIP